MASDRRKCPQGLPPWLSTFADLMSLLMCFFVLLLSFAEIDAIRFKRMADSLKDAFGVQRKIPAYEIVKGTSVIKTEFSSSNPSLLDEIRQQTTDETKENLKINDAVRDAVAEEQREEMQEEIEEIVAGLREALADVIEKGLLGVETEERKIIIRIQEKGSFASGSADLDLGFMRVMERISKAVGVIPGKVVVAGHTDNVPIFTSRFRSNWELSSARAVTVVHALLRNPDVDPLRVLVEGHADSAPVVPNDTADNRAKNRRVELILLRGQDEDLGDTINVS